jgi:hypothetical protein
MHYREYREYRKDLAEFERRLLLHIERRSERRSEWRRLRCLQRHRRLYRLGLITFGVCFALLAGTVVLSVLLLML